MLELAKGTDFWPAETYWNDSILFFETSEDKPAPNLIRYWLRNGAAQGILQRAKGIIFGKPQDETYYSEYKDEIRTVIKEYNLENLPILNHLNIGHTGPRFILPYGANAEINCDKGTFIIVENAVR